MWLRELTCALAGHGATSNAMNPSPSSPPTPVAPDAQPPFGENSQPTLATAIAANANALASWPGDSVNGCHSRELPVDTPYGPDHY